MTFGSLTILFDDRVLEPRPWTEMQSRWAVELLEDAPDGPVLELCAGAGQIGLLTAVASGRSLVAADISEAACELTRENAAAAGVDDRVEVRLGDLSGAARDGESFAVVVADPPWVTSDRVGSFPQDPVLAIDGGPTGLDVALACLRVAEEHLLPGGSLVLQLGSQSQADEIAARSRLRDAGRREAGQGDSRGVVLRLVNDVPQTIGKPARA